MTKSRDGGVVEVYGRCLLWVMTPDLRQNTISNTFCLRDLTIFMSYMRLVCQVSGHQESICPVFTTGEKVMVPFKVKEKSHSPI